MVTAAMSTAVVRYLPPWLVVVVSLYATPCPPLSKSSAWMVVVAVLVTLNGTPRYGNFLSSFELASYPVAEFYGRDPSEYAEGSQVRMTMDVAVHEIHHAEAIEQWRKERSL